MAITFKTVAESEVTISELMLPSHTNFSGKIHGGYILSLLDQIAFACASKHSGAYCVTASVDTVDFLMPIEVGELVTMKASINFAGNSSMIVGIRVEAENIQTGAVKHCNSSYFTMVAKDDNGKNVNVPGLIIRSEKELHRIHKSIKRMELRKERQAHASTVHLTTSTADISKKYKIKIDLIA
ncbi:acyl-CoA thioesterase [Sinomicrobium pectinilyticum]|uniref:Acyl-CoA thioesterase n=1 Tax=Sinomicrobium pectinilyticum TaxID=1084421 RepID=A0A3N0E5M4_SINP1|nr:acyl-CoA thioesterase [Sinomicrobium pectinilyticum]RNL83125.1 acyl-CoA thioesterase [Sinomicrobium pectinilyticum]